MSRKLQVLLTLLSVSFKLEHAVHDDSQKQINAWIKGNEKKVKYNLMKSDNGFNSRDFIGMNDKQRICQLSVL